MARIIKDPKDITSRFTDDLKAVFGEGLVSVVLYGSAASGEYRPGESDINFVVVLSEDGIDRLDEAFGVVSQWKKRRVAVPLFLTEAYIETSLDVFPVEYLNFQHRHQVVFGKDVFADLVFDGDDMRLQCEREIKGKLLLLREAFLDTDGKGKHLRGVISESLRSFMAVFVALLFLKGEDIPLDRRHLVEAVCRVFPLNEDLFKRLIDIKEKRVKLSDEAMLKTFKAYLKAVRELWESVDRLDYREPC